MKIIASKSTSMRFMRDYNEGKVTAGTALVIGGSVGQVSMMAGDYVYRTVAEARKSRNLKNRYVHFKISLSPQDKDISNFTFRQIGKKVLAELGYSDVPYTIYRHTDTDHPHIHITVSRVTAQGELVSDSFDGLKMKRLEALLEKEFELTPNRDRLLTSRGVRLPGYAERWAMKEEAAVRKDLEKKGFEGEQLEKRVVAETSRAINSKKQYVVNAVLESLYDHPSMEVFLKRLARRGVSMVRHEFERNGKKKFGISYHYNPESNRARFEAKSMPARIAGDNVPIGSQEYFEHAYFDGVPVRGGVTEKGMPQLLLHNAKPYEPEEAVSFRALNLGPLFQEENLLAQLSSVNERFLNQITIKRTRKKERELFPDTSSRLLAKETPLESRAMIAAELRSSDRLEEVIGSGYQLTELNRSLAGTDDDLAFLMNHQSREQALAVEENTNPVAQLYASRFGDEPHGLTALSLRLIAHEEYDEFIKLVKVQMAMSEKQAKEKHHDLIDPRIIEIANVPAFVNRAMTEYKRWHQKILVEYGTTSEVRRPRVLEQTKKLIAALTKHDDKQVRELLLENIADVKQVPSHLLGNVSDKDLAEEIMERSVYALPKNKPTSAKAQGTSGDGKGTPNDNDLDQDMDHGKKMDGPSLG